MPQGLKLSRLWLAVVLVAFCLPLFIGLGNDDLETDEAIYSFAVDRILETGDWLVPKLSPTENEPFLEKPPLKFWIVAAPIRLGLLPHNEFGLRFWDAVSGSASFVYVFAIGSLLAGPVCGVVAVLFLFVHWPLVFAHGLRTNNMEAALVLCYCGGVFHFLRWAAIDEPSRRARHLVALALLFSIGFMTKFVAALFLPVTLAIAAVLSPRCRRLLIKDWRLWSGATMLVAVVCAPWFVAMHLRYGSGFWETIFGVHVLQRLTGTLVQEHLQPRHFYVTEMFREFGRSSITWFVYIGLATLLVQSIRRRWLAGFVVLLWATVPLAIISEGTSKLYHYAFPYVPPVALAAGYVVALVMQLAPAVLRRALAWMEDAVSARLPSARAFANTPVVLRVASVLIVIAAVLAIVGVGYGQVRIDLGGRTLFRSSGAIRPALLILLLALATRTTARISTLLVALMIFGTMPMLTYRGQLERLPLEKAPIRTAAECIRRVEAGTPNPIGMFVDVPEGLWHPLYYYYRRVQPWVVASTPLDPAIDRYLHEPGAQRPLLISDAVFEAYRKAREASGLPRDPSPPLVTSINTLLLLPGPFGVCSPEASLRASN